MQKRQVTASLAAGMIVMAVLVPARPALAYSYESVLNKAADMHWCTSLQSFCNPGNFARLAASTRVHMVCWRDDRLAYPGSSPRWFYVYARNGQEGYVHSSTVWRSTQITTPNCSNINWIRVSDWAIGHIDQPWTTNPAEINVFTGWDGVWSGDCPKFTFLAWAGSGGHYRANAIDVWNHYKNMSATDPRRAVTDKSRRPPRGALVFWNISQQGHIGISLGNWVAVSTQGREGQHLRNHVFRMTSSASWTGSTLLPYPYLSSAYLGWVMPQVPTVVQNVS